MPVAREFLLYYLRKDVDELLRRICVLWTAMPAVPDIGPFLRDVAEEPTWSDVR